MIWIRIGNEMQARALNNSMLAVGEIYPRARRISLGDAMMHLAMGLRQNQGRSATFLLTRFSPNPLCLTKVTAAFSDE